MKTWIGPCAGTAVRIGAVVGTTIHTPKSPQRTPAPRRVRTACSWRGYRTQVQGLWPAPRRPESAVKVHSLGGASAVLGTRSPEATRLEHTPILSSHCFAIASATAPAAWASKIQCNAKPQNEVNEGVRLQAPLGRQTHDKCFGLFNSLKLGLRVSGHMCGAMSLLST